MRLRRIVPSVWQLDAIDRLDATRMRVYFENSSKDKSTEAIVSERPMTMQLFDTMF